ncbi:MAG: flagellar transcriptional regulator FlhD [Lamprobacter sp.]|uniref:flagellar transcriptional regulator FlhD n=1 Tax=Lamprobacter sp. TaxID=3100796 RepID=UPI002B256B49|nr:flagellar transcriptional regulator FlhD [Lamprobacter sp.]MEA3643587.1 flagellar transcriptional regulator FlhD [Lamprobacter sp.]
MTTTDLEREIATLNLHWLLHAQALARVDAQKASLIFGLGPQWIQGLQQASVPMLRALADSHISLFRPRFHQRFWQDCLAAPPSTYTFALQALMLAAKDGEHP